jgi:hypothetical protein
MSLIRLSELKNKNSGIAPAPEIKSKSSGDDGVPDNIRNFSGPGSVHQIKYLDQINKSNFLITLNTNVSYKSLDEEGRIALYNRTKLVMEQLGERFKSGEFLKQFGAGNHGKIKVNVTKYEFHVEIGNKHGFMHAHAILCCDEKCHINLGLARSFTHECYSDIHGDDKAGAYINVKSFQDTESVIRAYINKQQNSGAEMQNGNQAIEAM